MSENQIRRCAGHAGTTDCHGRAFHHAILALAVLLPVVAAKPAEIRRPDDDAVAGAVAGLGLTAPVDPAVTIAVAAGDATFLVQLDPATAAATAVGPYDSDPLAAARPAVMAAGAAVRAARRADAVRRIVARGESNLSRLDAVLANLETQGHLTDVERFPAAGILAVTGDATAVRALAAAPSVARLAPDRVRHLADWSPGSAPLDASGTGWNLELVSARQAWDRLGVTGAGVVVATIDTGVDWTHPALRFAYRGREGDHAYSWYDVSGAGPPLRRPADPHGHGTHVTGIIVGRDGPTVYGVAPGADWIAVRVFDEGGNTRDSRLLRAGEWLLAPTDLDGAQPRPEMAPDIVNCSWTLDSTADPLYSTLIDAWRDAGILPVFAAGNNDDETGTWAAVRAPGSDPDALAVGALTPRGDVWSLSRGGPDFFGGVKPDLVAPGVAVVSTLPGGGSGSGDGTSMAAPHVSGAAALLLDAAPHLTVDDLAAILSNTARDGGLPGPDDRFGWGMLDAFAGAARALTAGRLAGRITTADGQPLAGAKVRAADVSESPSWLTGTDDAGGYDFAVPAGRWRVTASAFGVVARTVLVTVVDDRTTLLDLTLQPRPAATVAGRVVSTSGSGVAGASVSISGERRTAVANADGAYQLRLPEGQHTLRTAAFGYRAVTETVAAAPGEVLRRDFVLSTAPRILVVDADAWDQERIYPYLTRGLDDAGYGYDVWTVDDAAASPNAAALAPYDVVLWAHHFNSPGWLDFRRGDTGVTNALAGYLASGGRLLVTGQDIGLRDAADGPVSFRRAPEFYRRVLGARYLADRAPGATLTGSGPLAGVRLELGWPLGRAMGPRLAPDAVAVAPESGGGVAPVLYYGDGRAAGLAASDLLGRRMYFAFPPESAGPPAALTLLLDRAVAWLEPPGLDFTPESGAVAPSETVGLTIAVQSGRAETPAVLAVTAEAPLALQAGADGFVPDGAGGLEWSGTLAPTANRTFRFAARLAGPAPGGVGLPVTATLSTYGRLITSTTELRPQAPDLRGSALVLTPLRLSAGGPVSVTLRLVNRGPVPAAAGADIELPPAMASISGTLSASDGTVAWGPGGESVQWSGDLQPGLPVRVGLAGWLPPGLGAQHLVVATLADGAGGAVTRHATVLVGGPDLINSSLVPQSIIVRAGEPLTLNLTVRNEGALAAEATAVVALPPGIDSDGSEQLAADQVERTATWSGRVPAGSSVLVPLALRVAPELRGQRTLTVTLADGFVPEAPVSLSGQIQVQRADLGASRTVLIPGRARSGDVVTATVLVGNHGDVPVRVRASDSLPSVLVVEPPSVRTSAGDVSPSPGLIEWVVDVPPGRGGYTWTLGSATVMADGERLDGPVDPATGARGPVGLGLLFPFHTSAYTQAWITDGGLLAFGPPGEVSRPTLGAEGPGVPALAPLWRSGGPLARVRVRRVAGAAIVSWSPGSAAEAYSVVLASSGAIRFAYGLGVDPRGAVVGLQDSAGGAVLVPAGSVVPGRSVDFAAPDGWQWLSFRARLGMSLGPNSPVTHTVHLAAGGLTHAITASVLANHLQLGDSRLETGPTTPVAGGLIQGRLVLVAQGDVEARGVEATIELPAATQAVPDSLSAGLRRDDRTGDLLWQGRVSPGAEVALAWAARVSPTLPVGAHLLTRASVRATGLAPLRLNKAQTVRATDFSGSAKWAWRPVARPGEVVTFTLRAANAGTQAIAVTVTDALPAGLELMPGALFASLGAVPEWDPASRSLRWRGVLPGASAVEIHIGARYLGPDGVVNVMHVADGEGTAFAVWADVRPAAAWLYLPVAGRSD